MPVELVLIPDTALSGTRTSAQGECDEQIENISYPDEQAATDRLEAVFPPL